MRSEDAIIEAIKQGDAVRFREEMEKLPDLDAALSKKMGIGFDWGMLWSTNYVAANRLDLLAER